MFTLSLDDTWDLTLATLLFSAIVPHVATNLTRCSSGNEGIGGSEEERGDYCVDDERGCDDLSRGCLSFRSLTAPETGTHIYWY
jgi:hypothetical protein